MKTVLLALVFALSIARSHAANPPVPNAALHDELRALKAGIVEAINKADLDRQLTFLHPNVVITWHNAEVSRGRDGVRAYYERLTRGEKKMVEKFTAEVNVDELTILHGEDAGIAFGSSLEQFTLTNGSVIDLKGRWTTTLVKEGGQWLVASLHVSTNVFDNVILNTSKKYAIRIACAAAGVAALLGWLIGRRRRKAAEV
jgi:ketosteroid isomerase-like protein